MSDNTPLSPGVGGDTIRDIDDGTGVKTQVVMLNKGTVGAESFWDGTVTGAFLTDAQIRATALPVSGTFFQATQPVSIAASVGVTGPLTDAQLRAVAVPVSGTFFQGTQPVSIAASVAVTGPLTDVQLRATAVPVSGTFFQGTQPVSLAINTPDMTDRVGRLVGVVTAANLDVALSTRLKPADTLAAVTNLATIAGTAPAFGTGARSASTQRVTVATDDVVPITNANLDVALSTRLKPADTLAGVTTVTAVTAITNALPTGTNSIGKISDITTSVVPGTAATNLGKAEDAAHADGDVGVLNLGIRRDIPNLPTAGTTSANGDYSGIATDGYGAVWVRKRQLVSYTAAYRLGDATAGQLSLTFTFVANTNKQLCTIYHTALAVKTVKIRKISIILSTGAAGVFDFEVRANSSAAGPTTGNPVITPRQHDPADGAAEVTCLALPTTPGGLIGVDSGTVSGPISWNSGAVAASGNPSGLAGQEVVLYEYKDGMEMKPLTMRAGNAEGFAISGRCTAAIALRFTVCILFTEE